VTAAAIAAAVSLAQAGSTVKIGVSFPPGTPQGGLGVLAGHLVAHRLFTLGPDGRVISQLAERWTRSADGRDWTFTLFQDRRFHDGTAADAEAIAGLLRSAISSPEAASDYPHLADIYDIRATGGNELVIRTRHGRILLLDDFSSTALSPPDPARNLGPYILESLTDDAARLRAFPQYFRGPAAIGRIELQSFRTQRAAWAALMRGEVDALHEISRDAAEFVEQGQRVRTYPFLRPYVAAIAFNVRRPPFRDPRVRQAIARAVERKAILRAAYRGRGRVADGPLRPGHWTLSQEPPRLGFDPAAAKAGLAHLPLWSPGGSAMSARVTFRCLVVPTLETQPFERVALMLQRQLYETGVDMRLEVVSLSEAFSRLQTGDFDAVLLEFLGVTPTWMSRMWRSPLPGAEPLLSSGYTAADAELDAVQRARTEDELRQAVAAVYRKMHDDPPAIFIAWPEVARAVSTRFDVPIDRGQEIMGANVWFWRPARDAATAGTR
jgi:peptide/nickel transport system substrate-binding protein